VERVLYHAAVGLSTLASWIMLARRCRIDRASSMLRDVAQGPIRADFDISAIRTVRKGCAWRGNFGVVGSTVFRSDQITGRSATLRDVAQTSAEWRQAEHRLPHWVTANGREPRRLYPSSETTLLQTLQQRTLSAPWSAKDGRVPNCSISLPHLSQHRTGRALCGFVSEDTFAFMEAMDAPSRFEVVWARLPCSVSNPVSRIDHPRSFTQRVCKINR
jgi:hypothetical protein